MQLARGNVKVQRSVLPEEPQAAVDQTVDKMMEIALSEYGSRSPRIRALAINIVRKAGVPEKDYYGEILAIHNWVKKNIRYTRDPVNQETLSYPEETAFNSRAGDCDDMTVLEIALLAAIGLKSWPVTIGLRPGTYSHVYLRAQVPPGKHRKAGKVINLDPIMKEWGAGREAPRHKVKQIKDYRNGVRQPQRSVPMRQQNGMDSDLGDPYGMLPGLGDYVSAPSYLDDEHSHAQELLAPDPGVRNTPKVSMPRDGLDGMFGLGAEDSEVVQVDEATPMQNPNSLDQLGPKGPMTARQAQMDTRTLRHEKPREIGAKTYEAPNVAKALRHGKGGRGTSVVDSRRTIVTVCEPDDAQAAREPKNADEESGEINGLGEIVTTAAHSFLPGLGALGEEGRREGLRMAIASSWAELKARLAAARAAWAEERARQARVKNLPVAAQAMKAEAAKEKANEKAALKVAEAAGKVSRQMARQDPQVAAQIAMADQVMRKHAKEVQALDGDLGLSVEEMKRAAPNNDRRIESGQRARPIIHEATTVGNMNAARRRIALLRRRREIIEKKLARLEALVERGLRAQRRAAPRRPTMAPIPVLSTRRPEEKGRRHMLKAADRGRWTGLPRPDRKTVPARAVNGLGEFSLSSPMVWGPAALIGLYLMKRKK